MRLQKTHQRVRSRARDLCATPNARVDNETFVLKHPSIQPSIQPPTLRLGRRPMRYYHAALRSRNIHSTRDAFGVQF